MSSENSAEFTHPGPILRAARDELRLSIEHVAERLHLRPSVVALIESETYDDFSSDVFLKGYFRSYCRLVGLHEERMVELLERQLADIQEEELKQKKSEAEALRAEKRMHMFKLGLVVSGILIVCAGLIWFLVGSSGLGLDASDARQERIDAVQLPENEDPANITAPLKPADNNIAPQRAEDGNKGAEGLTSNAEDGVNLTDGDDFEAINLQEKASAADLVGDANPEKLGENEAEADLPVDKVQLSIAFTDECWFEAYDAQGKRITAALKQDGSRFEYEGPKPIRVVLGNGNAASVEVDGLAMDISSNIRRSGRAELVIE